MNGQRSSDKPILYRLGSAAGGVALSMAMVVALSAVLTLFTQQSSLGQSALFSPLPTVSPLPTPIPTRTPTATPTPAPSPTPRPLAPVVSRIEPDRGPDDRPVQVMIQGRHFSPNSYISIGQTRAVVLEGQGDTHLMALIPAGIAPGVYPVRVCNPDFQCGYLSSAYTVVAAGPALISIWPNRGRNDGPTEISVSGLNLKPGLVVTIGEMRLRSVTWIGPTRIDAVVPPGLSAGTHDVIARNPDSGIASTLHDAYTAVEPARDDFSVSADDIWTLPRTLYAGDRIRLGANVGRQGGERPNAVTVAFYRGNPAHGGELLGQGLTLPIPNGDGQSGSASILVDTSGMIGEFDAYVVVDPDGQIAEVSEANNVAFRRLVVKPPARDEAPPRITRFAVNGSPWIVTSRDISLTLLATDTGGTGLRSMALVEWEFRFGANQWVPTHRTGWLPYAESFSFRLEPHGGARVLEAWVADGAGNISSNTGRAQFAYVPMRDSLSTGVVRSYLQTIQGGSDSGQQRAGAHNQAVTIALQTLSGDADLYVWSPDLSESWWSADPGPTPDQVSFTASQTGTYIIEVVGYEDSEYTLSIQPGGLARTGQRQSSATSKPARDLPALAPQNFLPEETVVTTEAPQTMQAFLPIIAAPAQFQLFETFAPIALHEAELPVLPVPPPYQVFAPVVTSDDIPQDESPGR